MAHTYHATIVIIIIIVNAMTWPTAVLCVFLIPWSIFVLFIGKSINV